MNTKERNKIINAADIVCLNCTKVEWDCDICPVRDVIERINNAKIVEKRLYISNYNRDNGYTPENDYDPRYYDLSYVDDNDCVIDESDPEIINTIIERFGEDSFSDACYGCIYTENYDVMKFLQEETIYGEPIWFDTAGGDVSTIKELGEEGWTW